MKIVHFFRSSFPNNFIESFSGFVTDFRDGKWLKVNYRADKEGFHVLSEKLVSEAELNQPSGGAAADHQAKVETQLTGSPGVKYTVKEDELKKAKNQKPAGQEHGGL